MSSYPRDTFFSRSAAGPPPEAMDAVAVAAGRWEELEARGRELRFVPGDGHLRIELRSLDGRLIRLLRPSAAIAVALGAEP